MVPVIGVQAKMFTPTKRTTPTHALLATLLQHNCTDSMLQRFVEACARRCQLDIVFDFLSAPEVHARAIVRLIETLYVLPPQQLTASMKDVLKHLTRSQTPDILKAAVGYVLCKSEDLPWSDSVLFPEESEESKEMVSKSKPPKTPLAVALREIEERYGVSPGSLVQMTVAAKDAPVVVERVLQIDRSTFFALIEHFGHTPTQDVDHLRISARGDVVAAIGMRWAVALRRCEGDTFELLVDFF